MCQARKLVPRSHCCTLGRTWDYFCNCGIRGTDFNRLRGVFGGLWQGRYKARLLREQEYLEQLFAYVHLNPVERCLYRESSPNLVFLVVVVGAVELWETGPR